MGGTLANTVLGLNFGHDAAVVVLVDGQIRSYVLRERFTRVKHAATLTENTIRTAISVAGIELTDIDHIAIASTQFIEPVVDNGEYLQIALGPYEGESFNSLFYESLKANDIDINQYRSCSLLPIIYNEIESSEIQQKAWSNFFPESRNLSREEVCSYDWIDQYHNLNIWHEGLTLEQIESRRFDDDITHTSLNRCFHYPVTVTIEGNHFPGCYVHHHMAHAAASFYMSGFDDALVLTHDGFGNGHGYHSGLVYYGLGSEIHPIGPHHLAMGGLYDYVGVHLGLGFTGPAGKLMGLAAYGKPHFYDEMFVGNDRSYRDRLIQISSHWIEHCESKARQLNYDFTNYRNPLFATDPINADIAASTQKLFEACRFRTVKAFENLLANKQIRTANLCLSGGTALNCPSNTQIYQDASFRNVYVEPCCDDSGISIGAALFMHHNIMGNSRLNESLGSAYLGIDHLDAVDVADLLKKTQGISYEYCTAPAASAGQDLAEDMVIGWYQGRSEVGPRALGNRSILAHPGHEKNWLRVNNLKKRESWRPFAPSVLESEAANWFTGAPIPSPYMLFNAQVNSDEIPAVTHVDSTARIQTVNESNGVYFDLINSFFEITGIPVILNTSFNGPGEPIVEKPEEALNFLLSTELDKLYLGNYVITRSD